MLKILIILLFSHDFLVICSEEDCKPKTSPAPPPPEAPFIFWPNATIPFYINPDHFDKEQTLTILKAISTFGFKTCLKFAPVMVAPEAKDHVLVFVNHDGVKRCAIDTQGHSNFQPHIVHLGYDCLRSPNIEMMIMRSLGFPFEHNRMSRNVYINVLFENLEPSAVELYTKDAVLPPSMRIIPYDYNSVMHFGERDYSRNGHRTILFKDPRVKQRRSGLTQLDLKKIDAVYGPVCRERDRREKIDFCQTYPGVARRKRDTRSRKSLRVNPDITPPPNIGDKDTPINEISETLIGLGINDEAQEIIEKIYKMGAKALDNARVKYCNKNVTSTRLHLKAFNTTDSTKVESIWASLADYSQFIVNNSLNNLTELCLDPSGNTHYQRYYSTKLVGYYSTNIRPIQLSTMPPRCCSVVYRSGNDSIIENQTKNFTKSPNLTGNTGNRKKREPGNIGVLDIANEFTPTPKEGQTVVVSYADHRRFFEPPKRFK